MWAILDIENFYVSAERLFDPKLRNVPVIVLSNNDGGAVARSAEAKALHIKMGAPVFKMRDLIRRHGVELRSSNRVLTGCFEPALFATFGGITQRLPWMHGSF